MTTETAYKEALLDHYRHPRHKADPRGAQVVERGRNPRCGDDIEIGVDFDGDTLSEVCFHGRGCSICIASASMMTEAVNGATRDEARALTGLMYRWLGNDAPAEDAIPESLRPLSPVRELPARHRCVLLAWEALSAALGGPRDGAGEAR